MRARKHQTIRRHAIYPDEETAKALGGRFRKPRGGRRENRLWVRYTAEAEELLRFALAVPALRALLEPLLTALATRQPAKQTPGRPSLRMQEIAARQTRRAYFIGFAKTVHAVYLHARPDAPPSFTEQPRYLLVAFRRECVREHYRRTYGDPDYKEA